MQPDDDLCLCFHVTWRKVINYIRIHKVRIPSQVSQCQGAGTGCGWCRVFIEQLVERVPNMPLDNADDLERWLIQQMPAAQSYARRRANYIARGKVRAAEDLLDSDSSAESPRDTRDAIEDTASDAEPQ